MCSRGLGQATDLAVAQAVVDEREDFASDCDGGFVLAAPLRLVAQHRVRSSQNLDLGVQLTDPLTRLAQSRDSAVVTPGTSPRSIRLNRQITIDATNKFGERPTGFDSAAEQVKSLTGGPTAKAFNTNFAVLYDKVD